MNDSYKIYASKDYVDSKALPEGAGAYQQLVTDANGEKKWEERTHYTTNSETVRTFSNFYWSYNMTLLCESDLYLVENTIYTVNYNGKEYTAPALYDSDNDMLIITLTGDVNSEEEYIAIGQQGDACLLMHLHPIDNRGNDIIIRYKTETIKTIDPKYLPDSITANNIPVGIVTDFEYSFKILDQERGATYGELRRAVLEGRSAAIRYEYGNHYGMLWYSGRTIVQDEYTFAIFEGFITETQGENIPVNSFERIGLLIASDNPDDNMDNAPDDEGMIAVEDNGFNIEDHYLYINGEPLREYIESTIADKNYIAAPTKATVGQILVVKSIDENGRPTKWETIDPWTITSPNGTPYRLTVDDSGTLTATAVTN